MSKLGTFYGIGVGPGPSGLLPLAAWQALQSCDLIFTPRARHVKDSVARQCLAGLDLPSERFKEIIYNMDPDRSLIGEHYLKLAEEIAIELRTGKTVAYLTIGDSLTYSTYSYTLSALLKIMPNVSHRTFPGITSYAAIASALDWPLGQGKEKTLILPCPEDMDELWHDIETHDIVVLMKIGHRLRGIIQLLQKKGIVDHCVLASRIGLSEEYLCNDLTTIDNDCDKLGYLSTMLIRKNALPQLDGNIEVMKKDSATTATARLTITGSAE